MFSFPLTIHEGAFSGPFNAPAVSVLPFDAASDVGAVILNTADGDRPAGMYLFDGRNYRYVIPDLEISKAIIQGKVIDLYYGLTSSVTVDSSAIVYKNGILFNSSLLTPGSIYGVLQGGGGGGTGGVVSVNGAQGAVVISGTNGINVDNTQSGNISISAGDLDEGTF